MSRTGSPTLVCDLDGVVYLGETPVPGAGDALKRAEEAGWAVVFATNNSARRPADVVAKLARVSGYEAGLSQIVTSSLVAASLIPEGPVLVLGEDGVTHAVLEEGFELTESPEDARTVVVGLDRQISYDRIHRAATAVRSGAHLIATNRDPTFPTDAGLLPGAGACVAPVETASGVTGVTAGKPSEAMRRYIEARTSGGPIWMVGDRPDTDLALGHGHAGWKTALVLTGVTPSARGVEPAPDLVAPDLAAVIRELS